MPCGLEMMGTVIIRGSFCWYVVSHTEGGKIRTVRDTQRVFHGLDIVRRSSAKPNACFDLHFSGDFDLGSERLTLDSLAPDKGDAENPSRERLPDTDRAAWLVETYRT